MAKNKIKVVTRNKRVVDINVVPNQKVIEIHKVHPKKGKILDIPTNRIAQNELSAQAYVLYMDFVLNLPEYNEALSLEHILKTTTLSERGYYKAVKELIEKQYLVRKSHKDFSEFYHFYEKPQPKTQPQNADEVDSFSDESEDEI